VPSFDGTPLDVDVTLPPAGDGPFPTLVMEHGYPGSKADWESSAPEGNNGWSYHYNNVYFAQQGYAVVNLSARGFGRSCGTPDSRTAGCERGWTHIADQRFENRDVQHLLGLLVDQRVARPDALGVTGLSGGGGRAVGLAFLRDSIRLPDGTLAPWRSPAGTPLRIAAAYPRWMWEDLSHALLPNGRLRGDRVPAPGRSRSPLGVAKRRWIDLIHLGGVAAGYVAPPGADDQADLTHWRDASMREPYGEDVRRIGDLFSTYLGGAAGLAGRRPAPMVIGQGWTDGLFPGDEALRVAERARAAGADVSVLLGDFGHGWAGNPMRADREINDAAAAFLRQRLQPGAASFVPGATVYTSACPKGRTGRRMTGDSLAGLARGTVAIRGPRARRFTWRGGSRSIATALDDTSGDWCRGVATRRERNTATYEQRSRGVTLVGSPVVTASVRVRGFSGQIAARLLDVGPRRARLIARGLYRLKDHQRGVIRFELHPNAYRFARGHRIRLQLLGRDAPYAQAPQRAFSVRVSRLRLELPVRERPSRRLGVRR
jgi:dienelactone hydrolase